MDEASLANLLQELQAIEDQLADQQDAADQSTSLREWLLATSDPDPWVRLGALPATTANSAAARRLRRSKQVARRLVELLRDETLKVRVAAAVVLMEVRAADALPGLRALLQVQDWRVRCQAALAIGRQGGVRAVGILHEALRAEPEPEALPCYARALGATGDASAVADLLLLGTHTDWRVRWSTAQSLDDLRHPDAARLVDELAQYPGMSEEDQAYLEKWRRRLARRARAERRRQSAPGKPGT